ncbi:interferon-inducible GTPase 5-like [Branchiostoma floridae]|uniref:Interferon-inducible GTPase 5-like n=1 Tax=Branchiostoma floridae TaxID=7739 RepID=A0A9J7L7W5_BRAFL|nr:interferon-inducible GTPase 5-like [Branchiostoma floridae]
MGVNQSKSCEPQGSPDSDQTEVMTTSADGRVEIKKDDLGPEEQEKLRMFADKVKNANDQSSAEMIQTLHEEVGQHVDEEAWMGQAYVRIGIVGVTGAGKSTFINSFRGLEAGDPGAAAVDTIETTADTAEYPHPEHDHVILVDFPGALFKLEDGGRRRSAKFDMKEYTRKFGEKMRECNVFLVFTSDRVHDNAVWIAAKAREIGKKVLFVRSKFDQDVANKRRDDKTYFAGGQEEGEERLLQFHRQDYVTKLETMGYGRVAPEDVFIISGIVENIQRGRWDATALKEAMLKQLNIPQQMLFITICIVITTVMLFKRGFGLNEDSVRNLATLTGKDVTELQRFVDDRLSLVKKITQFFQGDINRQNLKQALVVAGAGGVLAAAIAVDVAIDTVIPFVGGLVTAPASFGIAWKALCLVIEQQEECALGLYDLAFQR